MAFHRYPQLIRAFCNMPRFGPPRACSARFSLATGRSPGFGSTRDDSTPFRTRLRSGSACPWLSLAAAWHSSAHSTKGTPSPPRRRAPTGRGRTVSGLFHSPRRGAFHRSLTVLVHCRSSAVFSLGPWSAPLPAGFRVSGGTHATTAPRPPTRRLRGSHPLRRPVPAAFGCAGESRGGPPAEGPPSPVQPRRGIGGSLCRRDGLGSSPFARRYWGNPLFSSGY